MKTINPLKDTPKLKHTHNFPNKNDTSISSSSLKSENFKILEPPENENAVSLKNLRIFQGPLKISQLFVLKSLFFLRRKINRNSCYMWEFRKFRYSVGNSGVFGDCHEGSIKCFNYKKLIIRENSCVVMHRIWQGIVNIEHVDSYGRLVT